MRLLNLFIALSICYSSSGQSISNVDTARRQIVFSPTVFYNEYNASIPPALIIRSGDSVNTESLDALGFDKDSVRKGKRGNPLTGPFFVKGAHAGDVLAVTIIDLSLNRTYGTTLSAFIPKILAQPLARQLWRNAKLVKWNFDTTANTATPEKPYEHLSTLRVPLHPFLGSVGVAPPGKKGISSGGYGTWGGNLDFRNITKGATVYLPVYHQGALLLLGDGHALQGDGELNGDALETSLSFTFRVDILKKEGSVLNYPRVEDQEYIMAFGQARNVELAIKEATLNLISWVQEDYHLSIEEASQLLGSSIEFRIPKVVPGNAEVVAKISKSILKTLSDR